MLDTLKIKNIAVIDEAEVAFKDGLNILSGETGAGKSIIIASISLLLGARASADLIRKGCDEAVVEGLFNIQSMPWIHERLKKLGFLGESEATADLLIKRVVLKTGRHRIYVNGELSTLALLQELSQGLVDLCGQHDHQTLLQPLTQLDLLDRYGNLSDQALGVGKVFGHLRSLKKEEGVLLKAQQERLQKGDFIRFQVEELTKADLQPGEDEKLQGEKRRLQGVEQRGQVLGRVCDLLDQGSLDGVRSAVSELKSLEETREPGDLKEALEGLERASAELEEASLLVNRAVEGLEQDPTRLEEVSQRLALIADLRRKYGQSIEEIQGTLGKLESEREALEGLEERLADLKERTEEAEDELFKLGKKLSSSRRSVAKVLGDSVTQELQDLKMKESLLEIGVESKEDLEDWTQASGADTISFQIQTNVGEDLKPLSKIASGGELSRVMLAIRRVIADRGRIGVYLFDEIDAGMGGQTAFQVGRKLKSVSQYNQVICITHLPQVASFADHHVSVRKATKGRRTLTELVELDKKGKREEVARMLGGDKVTKTSLKNAQELLDQAVL